MHHAATSSAWPDLPDERFVPDATAQVLDLSAVATYLAQSNLTVDTRRGARQLAGGLANQNFLVSIDGTPAVLRRPPGGPLPPGAHDMAREHRILSRLPAALPEAPRSFHFCDDAGVIGVPFQLIEFRDGLTIRGDRLPATVRAPEACRRLSTMLVEMLARIHGVDAAAVGLGALGRPAGFFGRAVEGWAGRASTAATGAARAAGDEVVRWLRAQKVADAAPTLLHCDFKLDNCILDSTGTQIVAVIDWDMGTRGDPLFDLATTMSYWTEPGDPPCLHALAQMPTAAPGFLSRAEAVALYGRLTGRDLLAYPTFRVLAAFKLAIVFLQLYQRWENGALRGPQYQSFRALGGDLLDYALDISRGRYP
jgi:aminoglycoside phosphotransferase (APT) family kinase protein